MAAIEETFRKGTCVACGVEDDCIVLAGQLLCGACDSLGRIAAAKMAHDDAEKYRQGVSRGYGGNVKAGSIGINLGDTN